MIAKSMGALLVGATLFLTAGCGGGGGGSSSRSGASVSLLVGDAPTDALSSFEMTLDSVVLTRDDGSSTSNLLATPRTVDLLALRVSSDLLQVVSMQPGTYTSALLSFDPTSIVARDKNGAPVAVHATAGDAIGTFSLPVAFERDDRVRLHFEFELDDSLFDDGLGGFDFTPKLLPTRRAGADDLLNEVHGRLLATNPAAGTLTVDLLARDDAASRGTLGIAVEPATLLVDDDGNLFSGEAALFAFARAGDRVEARGGLGGDGLLHATFLQVERDDHGLSVARVRGTITALDLPGAGLALRLRSIEFGAAVVRPVLESLGNPAEIAVDFSSSEIELRGADPRHGTSGDLVVGQEVEVEFSAFATSPFPARSVEVEDERAEFEGRIVDSSGLPSQFIVHFDGSDPAILDGRVASTNTDVSVGLDGSERLFLDVAGEPSVPASSLRAGLSVRVRGDLSGTPSTPALAASEVRVRPGRLRGLVTATDAANRSFTTDVDRVDDPFGGSALPDPVGCTFPSSARVTGDASSVAGFFSLFDGLGDGKTLEIELFGLADGAGGATAYEVAVRVK